VGFFFMKCGDVAAISSGRSFGRLAICLLP